MKFALSFLCGIIILTCSTSPFGIQLSFSPPRAVESMVRMMMGCLNIPSCEDSDDGWGVNAYRPIFYSLAAPFADLVGREVCNKWEATRSYEESQNECIAVSFIKHFDIAKNDFERANEQLRQIWAETGSNPEDDEIYELYNVDLLYTFNNHIINEYYRRQ